MFCPKDRKVKRMTLNKRLAAVSTALILSFGTMAAQAQDAEPLPARVTDFVRTVAADDHVIGSEDAAITLIIWASVTCPHCGQWFSEDWPVVKKELVETGKLRVAFRDNAMRAQVAEIKGVPAFLINGETYKGAQDAKSLVELETFCFTFRRSRLGAFCL